MNGFAKQCGLGAIVVLFFAVTATSYAALIASEHFEYSGTALDGQNGGTGWSGAWSGLALLSNDSTSLLYPDGSSDVGARVGETTAGLSTRNMSGSIDLSSDSVYYMSYLLHKNDGGSVEVDFSDGTNPRWRVRWGSSEAMTFGVNSITSSSVGTYAADQTLFIVMKMEASSSSSDVASIAVFESGDPVAEPATWDATNSASTSVNANIFRVRGNLEGNQIDAIRIGTTFVDVVPEPTSLILISLAGLFVLPRSTRKEGGMQ